MGGRKKGDKNKYFLHWGKQTKHISGKNNTDSSKSEVTISKEKIEQLVNAYRGTGKIEGNKELINFRQTIGTVRNMNNVKVSTSWGYVHYDTRGEWHLVPTIKQ